MSCPQIWNIEQEKDREKKKVGGRPARLNEIKGDRHLERKIKNSKETFFLLEEQHENFVAAVTTASGQQYKVKMSGSEKKNEREHVRHFLQKNCN